MVETTSPLTMKESTKEAIGFTAGIVAFAGFVLLVILFGYQAWRIGEGTEAVIAARTALVHNEAPHLLESAGFTVVSNMGYCWNGEEYLTSKDGKLYKVVVWVTASASNEVGTVGIVKVDSPRSLPITVPSSAMRPSTHAPCRSSTALSSHGS